MEKSFIYKTSVLSKLKILGPNDCWDNYIKEFSNLDIYYSKEYVTLFSKIQEGEPHAAYFDNGIGKVFYPYIKRKIPLRDNYFDIITPYGYGGPVFQGKERVLRDFYRDFREFCLEGNIITETVALHPLLRNNEYIKDIMTVDYIRKTAAVDLRQSLEDIRKNYSTNNKRNVSKAIKEGVFITVSEEQKDIDTFINMYYETMDRNKASRFYYFDQSYFYRQMEETPLSKSVLLLAKYMNEIIGGVILIIGKDFAHYHLGGSRTDKLYLRPNNLLFDSMIEYAKSKNASLLHLGGGYVDNDSLYKFKTSFTNQNNFEYYLGKHIINQKIYAELTQTVGMSVDDNGYFPIYRQNKY